MDHNKLLDMVTELGYQLAMCGAETYRVEESISRITAAYGICAEVFAIPNCLHVTVVTEEGLSVTRMRRIGFHGNDLDAVEKFTNLSRRICAEKPSIPCATEWIAETQANRRYYAFPMYILGNALAGLGFSVLFGANLPDCLWAGMCGVVIGLVEYYMSKHRANPFFRLILSSFIMSVIAYGAGYLGATSNPDVVIIGALMLLVPGLLFTNAMRDIIYGDTNSGINRIVQVLLIAAAVALGTAAAWHLLSAVLGTPEAKSPLAHPVWLELAACFVGCIGFSILFNIHGRGKYLCALGGVLSWLTFRLITNAGGTDIAAYFFATLVAATYSEIMARVRKYPAISYLVVSIFPLIPGAGAYYAMNYAVRGNMTAFAERGMHTAAIAGIMAVGILIVSSCVRLIYDRLSKHKQ